MEFKGFPISLSCTGFVLPRWEIQILENSKAQPHHHHPLLLLSLSQLVSVYKLSLFRTRYEAQLPSTGREQNALSIRVIANAICETDEGYYLLRASYFKPFNMVFWYVHILYLLLKQTIPAFKMSLLWRGELSFEGNGIISDRASLGICVGFIEFVMFILVLRCSSRWILKAVPM